MIPRVHPLPLESLAALPVRPPYDLARTLSCGQVFGWRVSGSAAEGLFAGRRIRLEQIPGAIRVEGIDQAALPWLRRYLALDDPLAEIEGHFATDRVLRRVIPHTSGIAILRQDPWECLVGFIVSAFNNIPKIELTLTRLTDRFGESGSFPSPAALARARWQSLRPCAVGYRAAFLVAVARLVDSGGFDLEGPRHLPYDEARRVLLRLPGVGEKVADCVLLFGYGKGEAFPVDVWVKRAVERWYLRGRTVSERYVREFAQDRFGALAGYAQQHLFYKARQSRVGRGHARRWMDG